MRQAKDKDHNVPDFDPAEKQKIQRANQIFLRLRKDLHDRETRFSERDVREAAQGARWLREIIERYPGDWEQAYEAALAKSDLTGEDEDYLRRGVQKAGGFLPFTQSNLRRLEEAAPNEREQEREQTGNPTMETTHQNFLCGVAASIVAGGVMTGNSFYFGFGVGISRKADCW